MPHIHVEYSDNLALDVKPLLIALNQTMLDGAYVHSVLDVKTRAQSQSMYVIGLDDPNQGYIHVKVSLLSGRSIHLQHEISEKLLQVLQAHCNEPRLNVQLCVEILQMPKETYSKQVIVAS